MMRPKTWAVAADMFSARVKVPACGEPVSATGLPGVPVTGAGVGTGAISGRSLATFAGVNSEVLTLAGAGVVTGGSMVASAGVLTGLTCATGDDAGAVLAHAAVAVAKAAYKYSGAQDVVSCVTNPHLSSCIKAAVTIALVAATAGEVEVAAMNAAEEGGADIAEQAGSAAVRDFAHGTSMENAQSIVSNGLNEGAARAASLGGRYAQRGSFFSFEVTPRTQRDFNLPMKWVSGAEVSV
jgi:hypothetical protein